MKKKLTKTNNLQRTRREIENIFASKSNHIYDRIPDVSQFQLGESVIYQDGGTYYLAVRTRDGLRSVALT